jgi:predicted RecA/RadA family phage recombinase
MADPKLLSGDVLKLTAPAGGFTAGVPAIVGRFFVLPMNDAAVGVQVACDMCGVWTNIAKLAADSFAEGDLVYWDATPGELTTVAAGNRFVGHAIEAVAATTTTMSVRIDPRAHLDV